MTQPTIEKLLFPKQIDSCRTATARLNIWEGSVSSGKTYCSIWKWLSWLVNEAPEKGAFLMSGKTERTLARNILDPIQEMIGAHRFKINKGEGIAYFGGRVIYLASANDERSENKIRGMTLAGAYGDEITLWPESFFKMLLSRLRVKGARFYGTTNPDSPYHYLKTEFLDREAELNLKRFQFHLHDNTTLDPEYVASIEKEYTGLWYRRFILGEWCQAEGAIYDMYDQQRHSVPLQVLLKKLHDVFEINDSRGEEVQMTRQCVAVDYGTSNPTAALLLNEYRRGAKKHIHVANEYYYDGRKNQRQKTDSQYVSDFEDYYRVCEITKAVPLVIDPSAASLKAEAEKHDFIVYDAINDVLDGIRNVSRLFSQDALTIDTKCQNLNMELPSYVWDKAAQIKGEDKPLKQNDHACDALRYGCMYFEGIACGGGSIRTY